MSEEEQHQIIGRTIMERADAVRKLAALKAKASGYADHMRIVWSYLSDLKANPDKIPVEAIERCPNSMDLMRICGEIRDTKTQIAELSSLLREMGADS